MFEIYLPIAEVFINGPLLLLISTIVGLLTGMLGIGGGFLMTPILIFSEYHLFMLLQIAQTIFLRRQFLEHLRTILKDQLDLKMGALILIGGIIGSIIGIEIFIYFLNEGSLNYFISILF